MARHKKRDHRRREQKFQYRTNRDIRVPRIRLVGDNLEAISEIVGTEIKPDIYPTNQVYRWAQEVELDLVEISPKADPPV
ncbi:MAG: translation initiation factor IF-3, partial [Saprospiraceae bacterium]|nr:translation initiation factor IF-3 [Saprospiraceae bacterium]